MAAALAPPLLAALRRRAPHAAPLPLALLRHAAAAAAPPSPPLQLLLRLRRAHSTHDHSSAPRQGRKTWIEFPDLIELWTPDVFRTVGAGLAAASVATGALVGPLSGLALAAGTALYWKIGLDDMAQTSHSLRRNFPFLGNVRYLLESIRPEIRQYFIESDSDGAPFDRQHRSIVYQRAKDATDTLPFGTRRNVYEAQYEFAAHSMWPVVADEAKSRVTFGGPDCKKPYSASILNVSGMSYGALSENAVLALSRAAKKGGFCECRALCASAAHEAASAARCCSRDALAWGLSGAADLARASSPLMREHATPFLTLARARAPRTPCAACRPQHW